MICDCCDQCGTPEEEPVEEVSGSCPAIKYVSGGMSGSGFASRYWDCCKPSCSWTNNAGAGNEARQCDANMNIISNPNESSMCDGGRSTTCLSQIPFTIKGCDNLGFSFAAVDQVYAEDVSYFHSLVMENTKLNWIIKNWLKKN